MFVIPHVVHACLIVDQDSGLNFFVFYFFERGLNFIGVPGIDGGRLELPCSDHRWRGRSVLSTLDSGVLPDPEGGGAKIKLVQVMGWPMCAIIKI